MKRKIDLLLSNKLFLSTFINVILLIFLYVVFNCRFETVDDYLMKLISSGGFGSPNSHLVYINTILSSVLKYLYIIVPNVSWYESIQYLCIFVSLTTITYVVIKISEDNLFKVIIFALALFFSAYTLYVQLQYTKTAAILTISGYLLLRYALDSNSKKEMLFSVLLLFLGMQYRIYQFLGSSLICVGIFVPIIIDFVKNRNAETKRKTISIFVVGFISLVLLLISIGADSINYSSEEWKSYLEYNKIRTNLLDGGFPPYEDNKEFYISVDIDEDDYILYNNWDIDDNEKFDFETIKQIDSIKQPDYINLNYLVDFVYYSIKYFFFNNRIVCHTLIFLSLMVLSLLFYNGELCSYLYICISFVACVLYSYYIRESNHYIARVQISFLMSAYFVLIYLIKPKTFNISKRLCVIIITIMFIISSFIYINNWRFIDDSVVDSIKYRDGILKAIYEDKNHLYLKREANSINFIDDLFVANIDYSGSNLLGFGGWYTASPVRNELKRKYNVENSYRDIVNNDMVYYLSDNSKNDVEAILKHIQKHYFKQAKAIKVKELDSNYSIYKFITE